MRVTRSQIRAGAVNKKTTQSKAKRKTKDPRPNEIKIEADVSKESSPQPWYNHFTKGDAVYNSYMKNEWGHEKRGDQALFEKLCLEGAQSGLSWRTILYKREAYRKAFYNFDPEMISKMTDLNVDEILNKEPSGNNTVVRHRGKLESVIHNAKQLQKMKESVEGYTNFTDYLWGFVDDKPILNAWGELAEVPSKTSESEAMSKALKKCGFKFVGPTTCYSMMQSCGFVIDHPVDSEEWKLSFNRLQKRKGGFQDRR